MVSSGWGLRLGCDRNSFCTAPLPKKKQTGTIVKEGGPWRFWRGGWACAFNHTPLYPSPGLPLLIGRGGGPGGGDTLSSCRSSPLAPGEQRPRPFVCSPPPRAQGGGQRRWEHGGPQLSVFSCLLPPLLPPRRHPPRLGLCPLPPVCDVAGEAKPGPGGHGAAPAEQKPGWGEGRRGPSWCPVV